MSSLVVQLQLYLVFNAGLFLVCGFWGSAEPSESLWLIERWNNDNALTSKWICFKHIDVVSCYCRVFTIPFCHDGTFTAAAEEPCSPGDKKKKKKTEQKGEKTFGMPLSDCHKHNLKWMLIFALHQAAVRPEMLRLTLCLRACESQPLLEADELCKKKKTKKRERRERHTERHPVSFRQGGARNFLAFQTRSITEPSSKVLAGRYVLKLLWHV